MSTDIGALQKQYAKLRKKQHHACVVISDIRPGRCETDVNVDTGSPGSPRGLTDTGLPHGDHGQMEGSVAMLTLSVPIETETSQQELIDPVSPTVFGETKCFFVQNVKKKKTKSQKHSKSSSKTEQPSGSSDITSESLEAIDPGAGNKTHHNESDGEETKTDKRVSFNEKVEIVTEQDKEENSTRNDKVMDKETESQKDTANREEEFQNNVTEKQENVKDSEKDSSEIIEISNKKNNVNEETQEIENETSPDSLESEENFQEVKQMLSASVEENEENSQTKEEKQEGNKISNLKASGTNEIYLGILKKSRSHSLRNPNIKFSKQFYPSNSLVHKKQRNNFAESNENANKQSIYQHFMMTKRKLSLDSALRMEPNQAAATKSIECPFPIQSVNEHKIKAGMRLGLYDEKALEKIEKTKKVFKSKLPNLTFD